MTRRLLVLSLTALGLLSGPAHAQLPAENRYHTGGTYLQVETVDADLDARTATVNVRWDASWRDSGNWDAAWIVLKGRRAGGSLVPLRVQGTPTVVDDRSPDGSEAAVHVPGDRVGFFVHRAKRGEGRNHWRLRVSWAAADSGLGEDGSADALRGVDALGVEVVRVPTGPFELGTTRSLTGRKEADEAGWLRGTPPAPLSALFQVDPDREDLFGGPYRVTSEDPISIGTDTGDLYYIDARFLPDDFSSGDQQGTLSAGFPKGYQGFYQMKYEVTERQYVDFLNGLSAEQARIRAPTDSTTGGPRGGRYTISRANGRYRTKRPHRAATYLSWQDAQAWADWMGLRPMTGLEFEKSARGAKPAQFREFVWGVSERETDAHFERDRRILAADGTLAAVEDGTERVDGNVHVQIRPTRGVANPCTKQGDNYLPWFPACRSMEGGEGNGWGPLRVGIHGVGSGGGRIAAGAGYYGAMDLGGNAAELVVTLGHSQGRAFRGTHGDGRLSTDGLATNADWHADADTSVYGTRGASWTGHPNHTRTADRFFGLKRGGTKRSPAVGFRAVRTVR